MPYDPSHDTFRNFTSASSDLGRKSTAITPSDTVDLTPYPQAIVVTAAGNIVLLPMENDDDDTVTFTAAPVGFVAPFRVRRVLATGTTASVATIE